MYEEYLEDYVYKLMSKIGSKLCRMFKSKPKEKASEKEISSVDTEKENLKAIENKTDSDVTEEVTDKPLKEENTEVASNVKDCEEIETESEIDDDLNNLNFHMMLFLLWICVTMVNIPALLTWARNFKYSMVLKPDTSYYTGLVMSACSVIIWQMNGPRKDLKYYDAVCSLLFATAVMILSLGPFSLSIVNYGITFMFAVITVQQLCDSSNNNFATSSEDKTLVESHTKESHEKDEKTAEEPKEDLNKDKTDEDINDNANSENSNENCDVCSENRIYKILKNLREKLSFGENS